MKINIAIDGPSASGKSTIAKALAKRLNYTHIDTGSMYRACAYLALKHDLKPDDEGLVEFVNKSHFGFNESGHILLNGKDIDAKIRSKHVDLLTSTIAQNQAIRSTLVGIQQQMANSKGFILDGRDIGSVVLKDAELKVFQTASIESRAKRRLAEYQIKGIDVDYQTIYDEIKLRDLQDRSREHSPLIQTLDAKVLDTSDLTIEQSVDQVYVWALKLIEERRDTND